MWTWLPVIAAAAILVAAVAIGVIYDSILVWILAVVCGLAGALLAFVLAFEKVR